MLILGVNVGPVVPRLSARGRPSRTGIAKGPVAGPVAVHRHGLEGDASAYRPRDLGDTAVHAFCLESYARFAELRGAPLPVPCFGENLTIEDYGEDEARIGDMLRAGTALLRVTQPVVRCRWPAVLSGEPRLTRWATREGLTGWFLEVLEPGHVAAGDRLDLLDRGPEGWTVRRLNRLIAAKPPDAADVTAALALPGLAERWKAALRRAVATPRRGAAAAADPLRPG